METDAFQTCFVCELHESHIYHWYGYQLVRVSLAQCYTPATAQVRVSLAQCYTPATGTGACIPGTVLYPRYGHRCRLRVKATNAFNTALRYRLSPRTPPSLSATLRIYGNSPQLLAPSSHCCSCIA